MRGSGPPPLHSHIYSGQGRSGGSDCSRLHPHGVTATDGPDRHYTEISALAQAPEKEKTSTDRKTAYLDNYRKHRKRTAMYQEIIARSTNTYDHENR